MLARSLTVKVAILDPCDLGSFQILDRRTEVFLLGRVTFARVVQVMLEVSQGVAVNTVQVSVDLLILLAIESFMSPWLVAFSQGSGRLRSERLRFLNLR